MTVSHRTPDASCWPVTANQHTPKLMIPPCKVCAKPSLGGVIVEMDPVWPVGRPVFTADFYCGEHNPGTFACMSDRLYPAYRIISMETPSRMKIQRLSQGQQEARVKGRQ